MMVRMARAHGAGGRGDEYDIWRLLGNTSLTDSDLASIRSSQSNREKARKAGTYFACGYPWTEADKARLREIFPKFKNKQVAKMMRRSWASVRAEARKLGLRKQQAGAH